MTQRHEVNCPRCGQKIGLTIREESLGGKIEVTCPKCNTPFQTDAPSPAGADETPFRRTGSQTANEAEVNRLRTHMKALGAALSNAVATDPGVLEAVGKIQEMGYELLLCLEATVGLNRLEGASTEMHESTPLVQNGEVIPGAFTKADESFMKNFRIKF